MSGAAAGGSSPGACAAEKPRSQEFWAGAGQGCRAGREAGLTCRSRGTHLPPRAPSPPAARRWQLRCEQHPACWRQLAPWQLKAQRMGLGQRALSPGSHIPSSLPRGSQPPAPSSWWGRSFLPPPSPRSLSFSALPPWGAHSLEAVRTRGREIISLTLEEVGGSPSRLRPL